MSTPTSTTTVKDLALQFNELVLGFHLPPVRCAQRIVTGDTIIWHCRNDLLERTIEVTTARREFQICSYNFDTDEVDIAEPYDEPYAVKRLGIALDRLAGDMEG